MDISEVPRNFVSMARSLKDDEALTWYLKSNGINFSREEILEFHKDSNKTPKPTFREL